MKRVIILILFSFAICIVLFAKHYPQWLNQAVFYQVYPQSFKDSNGDGVGDLNGISEKLEYLQQLGINALWLNPVFESPMKDAGYDVSDYYKIAPRYGTKADLVKLTREAHRKNIKVVFDLVAGHTSDQHPWFKQSAEKKPNKFSDFYIWTNGKDNLPKNYVSGSYSRNGNYMKNFFDCQPALNFGFATSNNKWEQSIDAKGPQAVKNELKNIIAYWMDLGIDGFRVDMASSLIKSDSDYVQTKLFWKEMRNWFSEKYPQGVLIAEWSNPAQSIEAGFMIDFMMHFNVPGYPSLFFNDGGVFKRDKCYFDANATGEPFEFIRNYTEQIQKVGNNGFVSVPTGNHDINRLNSGTRNTDEQLKTALLFLLTLKGIPFIFYGDEIGIPYSENLPDKEGSVLVNFGNENRAGSRTPMQWNNSVNAGFSNGKPNIMYLPLNPKYSECNVESQEKDNNSLLNFVKQILAFRKEIPALGNQGDMKFLNTEGQKYPLCYNRSDGKSTYLIVINPTKSKQVFELQNSGKVIRNVMNFNTNIKEKNSNLFIETDAFGFTITELFNR